MVDGIMKMSNFMKVYIVVVSFICIFILVLEISGNVCTSYRGFAVDNEENIYIGKKNIEVYSLQGEFLRSINPQTTRGYSFTIASNDNILISTGDYLYTIDLFGNVINKKSIDDYADDPLSGISTKKYISANGKKYIIKNRLFRTGVYRLNGKQEIKIYEMPLFDYIIKLLSYITYLSMITVIPVSIIFLKKQNIA